MGAILGLGPVDDVEAVEGGDHDESHEQRADDHLHEQEAVLCNGLDVLGQEPVADAGERAEPALSQPRRGRPASARGQGVRAARPQALTGPKVGKESAHCYENVLSYIRFGTPERRL